jgi:hypothetical protein
MRTSSTRRVAGATCDMLMHMHMHMLMHMHMHMHMHMLILGARWCTLYRTTHHSTHRTARYTARCTTRHPTYCARCYGGSHGGFLTAWLLGHAQHSELFRCGVLWNPVTNLPSMVTVTDIPEWRVA